MTLQIVIPAVLLLLSIMAVQPALATKWVPFTCDVGGTNYHNDIAASN